MVHLFIKYMYNTLMKRKLFRMNDLDPKFINERKIISDE